jgi:hypothetical protein
MKSATYVVDVIEELQLGPVPDVKRHSIELGAWAPSFTNHQSLFTLHLALAPSAYIRVHLRLFCLNFASIRVHSRLLFAVPFCVLCALLRLLAIREATAPA